jgi:CRP-like cAMP-binding protein
MAVRREIIVCPQTWNAPMVRALLARFSSLGNNLGMTLAPRHQSIAPGDPNAGSQDFGRALARALAKRLRLSERAMHEFAAGSVLQKSGDRIERLAYVMRGQLDVVIHVPGSMDGQMIPISFQSGDLCFLSYLFNHLPSGGDLVVRDKAVIRWVTVKEIEDELMNHHELLVLLVRFLGNRLREVQARERALSTRGVKARIGSGLLRALADLAPRADGRMMITLTHEQLAFRCGVSRPKASIALKELEQLGLIQLSYKRVEVLDMPMLRRYVM